MKQDLELLRVAGDDILLGLKLGQRRSEPYTKLGDQPHREGDEGEGFIRCTAVPLA